MSKDKAKELRQKAKEIVQKAKEQSKKILEEAEQIENQMKIKIADKAIEFQKGLIGGDELKRFIENSIEVEEDGSEN